MARPGLRIPLRVTIYSLSCVSVCTLSLSLILGAPPTPILSPASRIKMYPKMSEELCLETASRFCGLFSILSAVLAGVFGVGLQQISQADADSVTIKFRIPPTCQALDLIVDLVSRLRLKADKCGGGSDMVLRAWDMFIKAKIPVGMLVQGPSKDNDVDAIFNRARQLGAVEGPIESLHPSSSSRSFTGTGRLLSGETVRSAPQPPEPIFHHVVFWTNGFTVNDGPLRRLDDPENASFLKSIGNSECPEELQPADRNYSALHVVLARREENCPEPQKHQIPFQGVGRTLGSNTTSAAAPGPSSPHNSARTPSMGDLIVDENLPSTSIQLRLADGTRMVARFNHHHTISDIRAFIDASRLGGTGTYQLQTVGFPPKQLTDMSRTIEQAGLANSVVIQKF